MDDRKLKAELRQKYRKKFREHRIKCEAICVTNSYSKGFLGKQAFVHGRQCNLFADELTVGQRPVCWTHARAAENKQRNVPLEFVSVIDASVLPELQS